MPTCALSQADARTQRPPAFRRLEPIVDREHILKRMSFRAWHRGTREADYMIGGFFDAHGAGWDDVEIAWFERLLDQEDVDIMAWAIGTQTVPEAFEGAMMKAMQKLDYIPLPSAPASRLH